MNKLLQVDTNGENAGGFFQNLELYDLITPEILFLIKDDRDIIFASEIDWEETRNYFDITNNGHCIYLKDGGYIAAYEFDYIGVNTHQEFQHTLSDLCEDLIEEHNITTPFRR